MSSIARNGKLVHTLDMDKRIITLESTIQHLAPKSWLLGTLLTIGLGFLGMYFSMSSNIDGRLTQTDQRVMRVEQRLDRVEQRIEHIDLRIDRLDQKMDRLDQRVGRMEDQLLQIKQLLIEQSKR